MYHGSLLYLVSVGIGVTSDRWNNLTTKQLHGFMTWPEIMVKKLPAMAVCWVSFWTTMPPASATRSKKGKEGRKSFLMTKFRETPKQVIYSPSFWHNGHKEVEGKLLLLHLSLPLKRNVIQSTGSPWSTMTTERFLNFLLQIHAEHKCQQNP